MVKKKTMSLGVKSRQTKSTEIDEAAVSAFAAQSETERNKAPRRKASKKKVAKKRTRRAAPKGKQIKLDFGGKVVRDTFSMPQVDADLFQVLVLRAARQGVLTNKSEIVRAGVRALHNMTDVQLKKSLAIVEKMPVGRPRQ